MKKTVIIICAIFIFFCCKTNDCEILNVSCFTHYQINQADEVIIGTDKLPLVNVYDNNGKVIFNLPPDEESGWGITIVSQNENYFKVYNIWSQKAKALNYWNNDWMSDYQYVWVKKGSVGLNINNYDNQKVPIYSKSNTKSEIIGYIKNAQTVRVLDACKDWAYIKGISDKEEILGWLEPKWQCGSPLTTCN
jgi:hypothetical protein